MALIQSLFNTTLVLTAGKKGQTNFSIFIIVAEFLGYNLRFDGLSLRV